MTKQDPPCDIQMSRLLCLRCGPITAVMLSVICCVCVGVWSPGDTIAAGCGLRRRWTDLNFGPKSPIWSEKDTKCASLRRLSSAAVPRGSPSKLMGNGSDWMCFLVTRSRSADESRHSMTALPLVWLCLIAAQIYLLWKKHRNMKTKDLRHPSTHNTLKIYDSAFWLCPVKLRSVTYWIIVALIGVI